MAIAKMNKLTLVAESRYKANLLTALQEVEAVEVIQSDATGDALATLIHITDQSQSVQEIETIIERIQETKSTIAIYSAKKALKEKLMQKRIRLNRTQLEDQMATTDFETIFDYYNQLKYQLNETDHDLQTLREAETFIRKWQAVPLNPWTAEKFHYFHMELLEVKTEKLNQFQQDLSDTLPEVYCKVIFSNNDETGLVIIYGDIQKNLVENWLKNQPVTTIEYPYRDHPKEVLKRNLNDQELALNKRENLIDQLGHSGQNEDLLTMAESYYTNQLQLVQASQYIKQGQHFSILEGWLAEAEVERVIKQIDDVIGQESYAYQLSQPDENQFDQVPTKLENNRFNTPFEGMTRQYGMPKYNTIDPTPYFSAFNILYFGLMSADVGYGLLLFIATGLAIRYMDNTEQRRQQLVMFNYMSVGTILVGLFYGSFFGFDLPFRVLNISTQVIESMLLSIGIGIIHLIIGYSLQIYLSARNKNYTSMYLDGIQWVLILLGVIILGGNLLLDIQSPLIQNIGLILIIGNIIGMFIVNLIAAKNPLIGIGKGLFGLINISGLAGDVISYTRLAALGISGANIAMAFNLILSLLPPFFRFTFGLVLFVILHGINIFIGYLGAYVHSMRLEYVEFFGKFFQPGGHAFAPLRWDDRQVVLERKDKEEK